MTGGALNRSVRGLFSKGLLLQIGMQQQQTECISVSWNIAIVAVLTDFTNMSVMLSDLLRNLTFNRSAHCTQVSDQCPLGLLFIELTILGGSLTEKLHNIDEKQRWHYTALKIHIFLMECSRGLKFDYHILTADAIWWRSRTSVKGKKRQTGDIKTLPNVRLHRLWGPT